MMRSTSFSIWELLHSSSQVPLTSISFARVINCFWLGTTKLMTYDWSLWSERAFPVVKELEFAANSAGAYLLA